MLCLYSRDADLKACTLLEEDGYEDTGAQSGRLDGELFFIIKDVNI